MYVHRRAFSLIEMSIAIAISAIVLVVLTATISQFVKVNASNLNNEKAIRNLDTTGIWFVRDFGAASDLTLNPGNVALNPTNGAAITIKQSLQDLNDTTIVYNVDANGNLMRQVTNSEGTKTSSIGANISSVQYLGGTGASTSKINITSTVRTNSVTRTYNVMTRITNVGLDILTGFLPDAFVGVPYSENLLAASGKPAYAWQIKDPSTLGNLPSWASLQTTGVISGNPVSVAPPIPFTVMVTDAAGTQAERRLSIEVVLPLVISDATLPEGEVNLAYSKTLAASGGVAPYTWLLEPGSGPLPDGLSMTPDGIISGNPTADSTFPIIVTVMDSHGNTVTKSLSITIAPGLSISTAVLHDGAVGTAYNQTLACLGGVGTDSWNVSAGSVPPGISLSTSGIIAGTPTTAGVYNFTVRVTDSLGGTATKSLTISIIGVLGINNNSSADGELGIAYNQVLTASFGTLPYAWSISAGSLPGGLTLNASSGAITGTPTSAGLYSFTVRVTDSATPTPSSATKALTININPAVSITTASLPDGQTNVSYSQSLTSSGGKAPFSWSLTSGSLPAGLTLNASNGTITGTPTAGGTSTFTIRVTDSLTGTATRSLSIKIVTPPSVTTSAATNITGNSATLNGSLTSLGTATTVNVYFQYGLDSNYGSNTAQQPKDVTGNFSASISGLSKKTTYHFRAVAVGDGITIYGNDLSFKTANK
jgi:prepilin-type N-terminal cleavage/methylation domain-containing protein